jgi:hypothetical protein
MLLLFIISKGLPDLKEPPLSQVVWFFFFGYFNVELINQVDNRSLLLLTIIANIRAAIINIFVIKVHRLTGNYLIGGSKQDSLRISLNLTGLLCLKDFGYFSWDHNFLRFIFRAWILAN